MRITSSLFLVVAITTTAVSAWTTTAPVSSSSFRSSIIATTGRSSSLGPLYSSTIEEEKTVVATDDKAAAEAAAEQEAKAKAGIAKAAKEHDDAVNSMPDEYKAALGAAKAKLEEQVPSDMHATMLPMLVHFVEEYMVANYAALKAGASSEEVAGPQAAAHRILGGISYGFKYGTGDSKFTFDVSHDAMRGLAEQEDGNTVDFYKFGCDFFRPAMDLDNSVVLGQDNLDRAMAQVEAGENVVFFANHQSEADPQVVSCCLEKNDYVQAAEDIVYVAGHKVTTDALAIPFSMGRNLLCIHSKKHINADASQKATKQKQNLRSMNQLLGKLKSGGAMLWLAPSGGRDRRIVETGEIPIAQFDSKTIDIFRLMGNKSKVKTHYYTLAMVTYDICPPPDYLVAGVGEERNIRFAPVGIKIGAELINEGGLEARHEFCDTAFEQCNTDYHAILKELQKE